MAPSKKFPEFILVEVESLKKFLRVGEVCGRLQAYKTKGTNICEEKIIINFEQRYGFAYNIRFGCNNSNHRTEFCTSSKIAGGFGYRVKRTAVVAAHLMGMRYVNLLDLTTCLGIGEIGHSTYQLLAEECCEVAFRVGQKSMADAVCVLRAGFDAGALLKTPVSGDGSYMTRGKKSTQSVTTLVSAVSGKIVDLETVSTFCQICSTFAARLLPAQDYADGILPVIPTHDCSANFRGKATEMERAALKIMFDRAPTKNKLV